jgi:hypothetical protein
MSEPQPSDPQLAKLYERVGTKIKAAAPLPDPLPPASKILQVAEAGALAPIQELADGMVISDPRVLVAVGNGKKFEVSLGRFRADIGDECWNLEGSGFDEA